MWTEWILNTCGCMLEFKFKKHYFWRLNFTHGLSYPVQTVCKTHQFWLDTANVKNRFYHNIFYSPPKMLQYNK